MGENRMTLFASILAGLGLSQSEAADYLDVRVDTLKSWSSGRRSPPDGVLKNLHELSERQRHGAEETFKIWKRAGRPAEIEVGLASDDFEAQQLGWPSVGAHAAVIRRIWEFLPPDVKLNVVPRGATVATAAAIEAHEIKPEPR